jgi:catechol 2,3-dioxygenase-like lactoylglutathione lyase family enzyme
MGARFGHLGFTVSDLDRSVDWYTRLLGAEPLVRKRSDAAYLGEMVGYPGCELEYAYFPLPENAGRLELIQYFAPAPGLVDMETFNVGNGHLCLRVDDIQAEFERLREHATLRCPAPVAIVVGPNAGGFGCYLRDPDGITIELQQAPPGGGA